MSRDEIDGLRRVVRIMHAVVVGKDHGGGTLKTWRNLRRKPLDMATALKSDRYPELSKLVSFTDSSGGTVDCERIVNELRDLWSGATKDLDRDRIRHWIMEFHPIASGFQAHTPMQNVFEQARRVVANQA